MPPRDTTPVVPKLRLLTAVLDDPTLELFSWARDSARYVDVHDGPGELATVDVSTPRVATLVEYETRKVGAILHDPRLLDFLEALDGNLTIESPAGQGTRLVAVFPV